MLRKVACALSAVLGAVTLAGGLATAQTVVVPDPAANMRPQVGRPGLPPARVTTSGSVRQPRVVTTAPVVTPVPVNPIEPVDTTQPGGLPGPATGLITTNQLQPRNPPPNLVEPPGTGVTTGVELAARTTPQTVADAQLVLLSRGFYHGPIEGRVTGPTRAAVRQFQSSVALPVTGELDARTLNAMGLSNRGAVAVTTGDGIVVLPAVDETTQGLVDEGFVPVEDGVPTTRFLPSLSPVTVEP